nr:histone deacetylase complex subunit SAP18-like [Oryctolagus cuniculus]
MVVESWVTLEEMTKEPGKPADCKKMCPLLLRVFITHNCCHHWVHEFSHGNVLSSELQVELTLIELTSLVKEIHPETRKKGTHFYFAVVSTNIKKPGHRVKEIAASCLAEKGLMIP